MTYEILIGLATFIGTLIGIVKPLMGLSQKVQSLTDAIDSTNEQLMTINARLDKMVDQLADHEHRITVLETKE